MKLNIHFSIYKFDFFPILPKWRIKHTNKGLLFIPNFFIFHQILKFLNNIQQNQIINFVYP